MKDLFKQVLSLLLMVMATIWCGNAMAQGPYSYNSPDGPENLFQGNILNGQTEYTLTAKNWASISDSTLTGIEITCSFSVSLSSVTPAFTFYADSVKYLEIFYRQNTLLLRRYKDPTTYYDYQLLDPLFVNTSGPWNVKLYVAGSFFWIQTNYPSMGNYLTPVYFGVNSLTDVPMQQLLGRSSKAYVKIGSSQGLSLSGPVKVFAFNPSQLMSNIQSNFSNNVSDGQKRKAKGLPKRKFTPAEDDEVYDVLKD
jgi:hypothetical protein